MVFVAACKLINFHHYIGYLVSIQQSGTSKTPSISIQSSNMGIVLGTSASALCIAVVIVTTLILLCCIFYQRYKSIKQLLLYSII